MIILSAVIVFVVCTLFLGLVSKGCWSMAEDRSDWTLVDLLMEGLFLLAILWVLCVTYIYMCIHIYILGGACLRQYIYMLIFLGVLLCGFLYLG